MIKITMEGKLLTEAMTALRKIKQDKNRFTGLQVDINGTVGKFIMIGLCTYKETLFYVPGNTEELSARYEIPAEKYTGDCGITFTPDQMTIETPSATFKYASSGLPMNVNNMVDLDPWEDDFTECTFDPLVMIQVLQSFKNSKYVTLKVKKENARLQAIRFKGIRADEQEQEQALLLPVNLKRR